MKRKMLLITEHAYQNSAVKLYIVEISSLGNEFDNNTKCKQKENLHAYVKLILTTFAIRVLRDK